MTRRGPSFEEIRDAVWSETVFATSTYRLLTRVVFPIYNEPRLLRAYPATVRILERVFTGDVLMAVCRLFDPADKGLYASLTNLLKGVRLHHAGETVPAAAVERRRRFERTIPQLLEQIEKRWKTLVVHRSGYLAHRDLSKVTKVEETALTYGDIRAAIEEAQNIIGGYRGAFEGIDPTMMFELVELRSEPGEFLRRHFELQEEDDGPTR